MRSGGLVDGGDSTLNVGGRLSAGVAVPLARNVAPRTRAFYRAFDFDVAEGSSTYGLSAGFTTFLY